MVREMLAADGECDTCRWFDQGPVVAGVCVEDVGRCLHPAGPLNAYMTRTPRPLPVRAECRIVSSGMTCERYAVQRREAA